jgi:hypothetical protein
MSHLFLSQNIEHKKRLDRLPLLARAGAEPDYGRREDGSTALHLVVQKGERAFPHFLRPF